jgi:inner membrane protein involved in colicin E2 resistance
MSTQRNSTYQKASRSCATAIACLTIAMLFFGVGVFAINPESEVGIISLLVGLVFVLISYVFFALYGHYSNVH